MSLKTLMRNILSFAQILQQAGTDQVTSWTEKSMQNALHWAEYCEQIYREVTGRPYEDEFEKQLINISLILNPPCCLRIDLPLLKNAKRELKQTLVQNPHLSDQQLGEIVDLHNRQMGNDSLQQNLHQMLHSHLTTVETILRDCTLSHTKVVAEDRWSPITGSRFYEVLGMCAAEKASVTVLMELLSVVNRKMEDKEDQSLNECYYKAHAGLIIDYLYELKKHCDKSERFHLFLEKLLERISKNTVGLELILYCVVYQNIIEDNLENIEEIVEVQKSLLHWILKFMNDKSRLCSLLRLDRKLLCSVSNSHTDFFNMYLSCLIKFGNQMDPVYHPLKDGMLHSWRYKYNDSLDYGILLSHIQALISSTRETRKLVCQKIKVVSKQTDVNVWQQIIEDCNKKQ